ncbi:DNA/RNA helicase domain-containing protein [Salinibacterium sp. GXW1014]|uniref:DNA/RNA helicase domain-containing protein n=1 Tax=Salinibacterium sp. GXW1014 TaxID=3377838 RepID=UPI00383B352D
MDDRFNKSVCLDLESYLIRLFAGDGAFQVLNRNEGITDADYYERALYRETFREVFDRLKDDGMFTRSIQEIENSDLFKLSPFKALTNDQAIAVEDILEGLFTDLRTEASSTIVIQGNPGTGKTVVAIYLLKLLADIRAAQPGDVHDSDSMFSEFFVEGYPEMLQNFRMGIVVPQQSLRESAIKVFRKTPGLEKSMVLTAFDVGESDEMFDLLIVDETHRLNQRANQPSGPLNAKFQKITEKLYGFDDKTKTQLDWIKARSKHQIFLVDAEQSVRPADLPTEVLDDLNSVAKAHRRHYPLATQMRVQAGADYVEYVRSLLPVDGDLRTTPPLQTFNGYDLQIFDDLAEMHRAIRAKDAEHGLARLVAGYAWEWKSKGNPTTYDIELDGHRLKWNSTAVDWIASQGSLDEVGSIHTVQGYDLNYAGVVIGADLRFDPDARRLYVDRASYFDKKGKENNPTLGKVYTDEDLLRFITNIYRVLLTRGIRGTYLYVCDPPLRAYLGHFVRE